MSQSVCVQCGNDLFLGEQRCGACGANAPHDVASFGQRPGDPAAGPPVGGASLIVQQGVASNESFRDTDDVNQGIGGVGYGTPSGLSFGDFDNTPGFDDVAAAMKVERDRDGNVVWDWKNALVGGIVVAVVVGVAVWWFMFRYGALIKPTSGISSIR